MKNPRQTAAKIHFVFLAATACLILTSGCSTHATSSPSQSTVYAQPGQTVKQLVDSLPANGGNGRFRRRNMEQRVQQHGSYYEA